jgi:3'5'-cyclic nucleotide phosphodiesterase
MLNPTSLLADALGRNLADTYRRIYGDQEPQIAAGLDEAARLVIERIASSDALYHNSEHTALVTLCVQDILRGRRLERIVTPSDWGHTMLAALCHDIGYVRGICAGDTVEYFVIDAAGNMVTPPRGASDAFLAPYHVERSKLMVRERFAPVPFIDEERIASAIELTRFPVPDDEDYAATDTEAGLVRAGDLIGQLGDPLYPRKLNGASAKRV